MLATLLVSLTAFSQSTSSPEIISPDKKVDSCYCFGVQKTKRIVEQTFRLAQCDSVLEQSEEEAAAWKQASSSCDSAQKENARVLEQWSFKEAKWAEEKQSFEKTISLQSGELNKESRKNWFTIGGAAGGFLLNALLTSVILIKR